MTSNSDRLKPGMQVIVHAMLWKVQSIEKGIVTMTPVSEDASGTLSAKIDALVINNFDTGKMAEELNNESK